MMELPALTKACAGLALACLLLAFGFLVVGPTIDVAGTTFECGAPALWYLDGREEPPLIVPFDDAALVQIPRCKTSVDERLGRSGLSAIGAITFLGIAVLATTWQQRRLRASWAESIRRNESGNFKRSRFRRR